MLGEHSGLSFMLKAQNWRFHSITIRFRTTYSYIHRVFLLSSYFDFFFSFFSSVSLGWTVTEIYWAFGMIFSASFPAHFLVMGLAWVSERRGG